ncbi:hypothetical protein DFZ46_09080 [Escherichia coli]|nr:hypothetical protein [Escherichia coli]
MKLSIDLSELIQLGKKMLPEGVDFFLDESPIDFDPIDIELSTGKEVSIEDLALVAGLSLIMAARFFYIFGTIQGVMMRLS